MNVQQWIMLALQGSILPDGLRVWPPGHPRDLLYMVRRPSLMGRSLVAMFVIMPVFAVVLTRVFAFRRSVEIALIALALLANSANPASEGTEGRRSRPALPTVVLAANVSF